MIVRALDSNNDWTFGQSLNNYKSNQNAVAQNIQTRLNSFLGDCFFDLGSGINWFNLIGGKDQVSLNLSISTTILNTAFVTKLNQVFTTLDPKTRKFTVSYNVNTSFGQTSGLATPASV